MWVEDYSNLLMILLKKIMEYLIILQGIQLLAHFIPSVSKILLEIINYKKILARKNKFI